MINIKNKEILKTTAESLLTSTATLNSNRESVNWVINEIEKYWESTGESKKEVVEKIKLMSEKLQGLVTCQNELGSSIIDYINIINSIGANDGGLK